MHIEPFVEHRAEQKNKIMEKCMRLVILEMNNEILILLFISLTLSFDWSTLYTVPEYVI